MRVSAGGLLFSLVLVATSGCHGTECHVNSDCAPTSPLRCGADELYCLDGQCHFGCAQECEAIRTDVNPCQEPRLCVPLLAGSPSPSYCSIMPIRCSSVSSCPIYRPETDAGPDAAWSCEDDLCVYPGFSYTTK